MVVIAILAFAVTKSYSQNLPSYIPTNGIGGYWGFNSNANDESSNANNGTIINGASLCDGRSGVLNNAFDFDGINGQINVNHSSSISPLNYLTVSAWIFPRVYEDNKYCVSKGSHINLDYRSYSIIGPQSNGKWMFTLNAGGSETQLESNSNATLNQWSLITVVYDGNQMYLYINGTLDNQTIKTGTINQTTEGLTFGSHIFYSYSDYWFNGKIDDIAIYNRALSQPEIIQLFTANQATDAFITTWVTDVNNETLTLPTQPDASNYTIDWGDGSATNTYTATQSPSHTYNNIGEHTVSITGTFPHLKFVEQIKLKAVQQWGTQKWTSMANMFQSCALLNSFPSQAPDLSLCTNMYQMFYNTPFNQPIGSWNVSQVTNMQQMFMLTPFNQSIEDWDVSQVTNMYQMFYGTPFNQPIGNWNVGNVSNMFQIFMQTPFNQPIGDWDVSKITSMYQMFYGTPFNQLISNWDVSHVTDMQQMFMYTPFNQPIGDWDVSQVTNMYQMFYAAPFNKPIGNWNVSQATNMEQMFMLTPFNQSIGNWDISQVTNMYQMLYGTNLSTVNYDATLIGWAARAANSGVKQMVTFSAGNSNYCNGVVARDYLTNNFGWNITDGGVDCISFSTESIQSFCGSATVGSLAATGSELNWFSTAIEGLALASDTPLVTGNYFVSQTINSIESARTEVAVTISPQVTPTFAPIASTCSGFNINALPTTSNNGITGTWSPAINNNVTTTYTFTPNAGQCAVTTTQTISITNPFITSEISFEAPQVTAASLLNVTVGTQIWTNKNLDIATYRDGTPIPQVTDPNQWANLTTGAWCYYNNDPANGEVYGKLYNWYAVAGIYDAASLNDTTLRKQFAPTGYHVPTDAEWTSLTTFLGSESVAGGMMKETSTELWNSPNQDANNSSGFTGLPGGYRVYDGAFGTIGGYGSWWSSSEYDTTVAWARSLGYWYGSAGRNLNVKTYGFSVRLIKD